MVDGSATARRRSRDDRPLALAAIALSWVLLARALLRISRRPIPVLERRLARVAARLPALSRVDVERAAWAVTAAARRVPGTRCLAWSLALGGLLAQMGVPSRLRFGVARQGPGAIDAHAWVECQGRDWSWGGDAARGYGVLRPPVAAG
jgi:hypothetical protein